MRKFTLKTLLLLATMLIGGGNYAWADATVQHLGSDETKTFRFTSSQTAILSGSTLTLDGMVMTFMGTNNTWIWNNKNNGMVGQNTPGNTSSTYYSTWSTSDGIPTYGSVYKFEASANGIVYLGGKTASTTYYIVKDDAGTLTIVNSTTPSAGWADIKFEMKNGETYYFFQLGSGLNAGRYTLTTVAYTKWSDINLTAVSEPKTWNYADLKAALNSPGASTDGTILVNNMTDDSNNSRLKFQTTLGTAPTELGSDMVVFKAGVAGQVYMKLADFNTTVSVYDGTTPIPFAYNSKDGSSQAKASYHGGNNYYKYATFQVEAGKQYYIYRTAASGGSPNAGVYFIDFQPTGNNTTTALTEATTWNYGEQHDILTEFHGITKDNMYYSDGLTAALDGSNYRLLFGATGSTSARYMSFKLLANVCGKVTVTPSCGTGETVALSDGTSVLKTFTSADNNVAVEVPVTTTAATTLYLYATNNDASTAGIRSVAWTPITSVPATITAAGYATFSSSYPLNLASLPSGLTAYYVASDGVKISSVSLTAANTAVSANTGLLLQGTANATYNIPVSASGSPLEGNKLVATDGTDVASGNYVFAFVTENPTTTAGFYQLSSATNIAAGKAYLNTGGSAKSLRIVVDGETTEVLAPEVVETEEPEILYNMAGQIVGKDYKGFVISNKGIKRYRK